MQDKMTYAPVKAMCARYAISRTTFWRITKAADFPRDAIRRVGARSVRFDVAMVDAYLAQASNEG
ncbi:AlpA family phage regulatory protein [Pseudomonas sp. AOB-7]|uniref:helix-turn-helix transcriptional regulator n=1 Tax=Pseudomonas sp. AOB-7 TaxID=2482750 RepID=UPI000EFCC34C|nr:AlpA family phage regulatory protein [Pseudomonas sp. AOB-7]RMH85182.1 AlpA family phage regulatory protein [Pseudomonas sp. AOB-7]